MERISYVVVGSTFAIGGVKGMKISKDKVKHIAELVHIELTEKEAKQYAKQLEEMTHYAKKINELNTDNVSPTTYVMDTKNVLRKDEAKEWLTQEEALKNAPEKQDGHFKVPSIMDE